MTTDAAQFNFQALRDWPAERRWRQQVQPCPVVAALVAHPSEDGRLLLIRRVSDPYTGLWALIGGKWEFGEEMAAAAAREVAEETGLSAEFVALRAVVSERMAQPNGQAAHFLLFLCAFRAESDTTQGSHEGEVAWFLPAAIEALNESGQIVPSDYAMIHAFGRPQTGLPFVEIDVLTESDETIARMVRFESLVHEVAK